VLGLQIMRILCADNSDVCLLGLRHALHSQGFFLQHEAHLPSDLIAELSNNHYDLIITEYRFGDEEILDFVDRIRSLSPNVKILVYTFHQNPTYVARASSYHLFDFITKSSSLQKLLSSVACASLGTAPSDSILTKATQFLLQSPPPIQQLSGLTKREVQVLTHLSLGLSNREISQALSISLETVKEHVQNILRKQKAKDRTEVAVWALRNGIPTFKSTN
jgi:DNA-binding NarL/FixJ family response regulator